MIEIFNDNVSYLGIYNIGTNQLLLLEKGMYVINQKIHQDLFLYKKIKEDSQKLNDDSFSFVIREQYNFDYKYLFLRMKNKRINIYKAVNGSWYSVRYIKDTKNFLSYDRNF